MTNDVVPDGKISANPLALYQLAIEKGLDPDRLGKLLDLAERWNADRAREAFHQAMNACQLEMPTVVRDAKNTQTGSRYAKLENILITCKPIYTRHGFAVAFSEQDPTPPRDGWKRTVCHVSHIAGHAQDNHVDLPLDGFGAKGTPIGNMNPVQAAVSTLSYGKRTAFTMAFGITIADEDDDGQGGDNGLINQEQWKALQDKINDCSMMGNPINMPAFLKVLEVTELRELPKAKFTKAVMALDAKARQVKK